MNSLTLQKVSFSYAKHQILHEASFSIQKGMCTALLGPSGTGKTTVGRILAGYEVPDCGMVQMNEQPLPKKGYCPVQLIGQHPQLAFDERMKMKNSLKEAGMPPENYKKLLKQIGIPSSWLDRFPIELSGGELQRVAIFRALHPNTQYLIADELSAMLDAITQAELWRFLLSMVQTRELGILMITHNYALAEKTCQRIFQLKNKKIIPL